jgi:hypothetical protein
MSFVVDIVAMVLAMPRALFPEVADERFSGAGSVFSVLLEPKPRGPPPVRKQ